MNDLELGGTAVLGRRWLDHRGGGGWELHGYMLVTPATARQAALWAGAWLRPRDNSYLILQIWRSTADPLVAVQPLRRLCTRLKHQVPSTIGLCVARLQEPSTGAWAFVWKQASIRLRYKHALKVRLHTNEALLVERVHMPNILIWSRHHHASALPVDPVVLVRIAKALVVADVVYVH